MAEAGKQSPWRSLEGKIVMVTGASAGIGWDLCLDLAKAGCRIIAAARRTDRLRSLCQEINGAGQSSEHSAVRSVAVELDVSGEEASIAASVQKAWDAFGRIDGLVNNAGIRGGVRSSINWSEEDWENVIGTNLTGLWLVSKHICKHMRNAKQKGSVINISSIGGLNRGKKPGAIAYNASKTGVHAITQVMALELGRFNIRVNAIAPGLFKSEITAGLMEKEWIERVAARTVPLRTYGTTDPALTSLVRYLLHESSAYISGNVFIADAGTTTAKAGKQSPWRSLEGKIVMVTGASSGIGWDLSLDLAKAGCQIIMAARRTDRLRSLRQEINGVGQSSEHSAVRSVAVELDVSGEEAVIAASMQKAWDAFGRIDGLVNNAGIQDGVRSSMDVSEEEWENVNRTNLTGLWLVSKHISKHMGDAKQKGSAMALELGRFNIRVNAIAPGLFKSEMTAGLMAKEWIQRMAARTAPLRTYGTTDPALTSLVRYLLHDSSSMDLQSMYHITFLEMLGV
ncbi:3-oxoacyl-acyl-carrier-protein reductase FabG [Canna indica]|uniref:3-oxoacyl-acyl-carrier-protein reductase FabG n=1 Tax=Canna indica TaxID=4628 RepID=A0AAQ3L3L5_9LILI|nr:3-oxoacyl-acyl-carrier-protein reductase FabG [Canna indica]